MSRASLRDKIIESGVTTVHERGFGASGIREITTEAGVPQGSFTNHFRSKEAFGMAVLDRYFERTQQRMDATLRDETRAPLDRLHAYFDAVIELFADNGWRYGCLIGNLSLEAAEHSEALRERLSIIFTELTQPFAQALRAGQLTGDVRADVEADELAGVVLATWYGTMLLMKVDRSREPLDRFTRVLFATFLRAPNGAVNP